MQLATAPTIQEPRSRRRTELFSLLVKDRNTLVWGRILLLISDADLDISAQPATKIQLAIVCLEMTLISTLRTLGFVPDVVIGHNLGEYTALNAGGVLSTSDVLYLVGRRAMLIEEYDDSNRLVPDGVYQPGLFARIYCTAGLSARQFCRCTEVLRGCRVYWRKCFSYRDWSNTCLFNLCSSDAEPSFIF